MHNLWLSIWRCGIASGRSVLFWAWHAGTSEWLMLNFVNCYVNSFWKDSWTWRSAVISMWRQVWGDYVWCWLLVKPCIWMFGKQTVLVEMNWTLFELFCFVCFVFCFPSNVLDVLFWEVQCRSSRPLHRHFVSSSGWNLWFYRVGNFCPHPPTHWVLQFFASTYNFLQSFVFYGGFFTLFSF